ncbi:MAG: hypothetical protein OWS74_05260, partial [Firmicutes bacterium]|nr:hypothetical protein [Bacillota bacterium]
MEREMTPIEELLPLWRQYAPYRKLRQDLDRQQTAHVFGLSGSLPAYVTAALLTDISSPALIVTASWQDAQKWQAELAYYLPARSIEALPPRRVESEQADGSASGHSSLRTAVLNKIAVDAQAVLIAPAAAVRQLFIPRTGQNRLKLAPGDALSPQQLAARLIQMGYQREEEVDSPGTFALR